MQKSSVTNGIALCPNMYPAFDRGLLSIEGTTYPYALNVLNRKKIGLPKKQNHYLAQTALVWHRRKTFKL